MNTFVLCHSPVHIASKSLRSSIQINISRSSSLILNMILIGILTCKRIEEYNVCECNVCVSVSFMKNMKCSTDNWQCDSCFYWTTKARRGLAWLILSIQSRYYFYISKRLHVSIGSMAPLNKRTKSTKFYIAISAIPIRNICPITLIWFGLLQKIICQFRKV